MLEVDFIMIFLISCLKSKPGVESSSIYVTIYGFDEIVLNLGYFILYYLIPTNNFKSFNIDESWAR
jgi:hypothetical protein